MLACVAEGRNHGIEEEAAHRRGESLSCSLTHADICALTSAHQQRCTTQDAGEGAGAELVAEGSPAQEEPTMERPAQVDVHTPTRRRMAATTALALRLAEASGAQYANVLPASATLQEHYRIKVPAEQPT